MCIGDRAAYVKESQLGAQGKYEAARKAFAAEHVDIHGSPERPPSVKPIRPYGEDEAK